MKSFVSYVDWAYYPPLSSNLSAFAAPFSVNRSNSCDVFVDSAESADAVPPITFPVQSNYGYDFFSNPVRELDSSAPSSQPYGYSGLQGLDSSSAQLPQFNSPSLAFNDAFSYDQGTKPSLVEAQSYYPSYISPTIHDPSSSSVAPNHWSSTSGFPPLDGPSLGDYANKSPEIGFAGQSAVLWNQFAEFNHGKSKQVGVGSSFSSKQTNINGSVVEERLNPGCKDLEDSNGEISHMIAWEKCSMPMSADHLDDKSCRWGTFKPIPVEFSGASAMHPPSVSLETHHETPLKLVADSGNCPLPYTVSYDKHMRQHDKPSRVDAISSTSLTGLVTDLNIGNIIADGDLGHNNFYNTKEAYHRPIPGSAGCFDVNHLRMHLERNELSSSNKAMVSDNDVSKDAADYIFKVSNGFQNPHPVDNLSLRLSAIDDVNSAEKSLEGGDRCNPAVDSPCWKGAPASYFSHCEYSEALPLEYVLKIEECFGSVNQKPQNFLFGTENNGKESCQNSNNYQMHTQETGSAGSPRKFSVTKFASEDCMSDDSVNDGSFQSEPSRDCGLQYLDDIIEIKEKSVPPTKPDDCEPISSCTEHQAIEENKLMFQKQHALCIGGADAGCSVNKCLEFGTSYTAEHTLSLPSSVVDAPTTLEKSAGKVSNQKLNVQMLVDTMHNLSELLLFHCRNGACELKEGDCIILKNVISNLNTCAFKNAEQITPAQECLFHQPETSVCAGESCELQQDASFKWPQLTKVGPESSKVELETPHVQEANLHFRSEKQHLKLSDSISPSGDAELTKADNMTKALKRILSENFQDDEGADSQALLYKNLWLEAEAALCSVSYRARYNQMKIEMEKHSSKQRDIEGQSKPEVVPSLSGSQISATKVHNYPNLDSSAPDFPVEPNVLKFSADTNKPNAWTPEGKGSQDPDSFIQNYTVSGTNKVAGNDVASVMAKFHVLKARIDKSCIDDAANMEEPSDIAGKLAPSGRDNQNQVNFCQDSPILGKTKADSDYEASVLARFHILKSRVEDSSSISSVGDLLDGVGFAGKGMDNTIITKNASEGKSLDVDVNSSVMHLSSYLAVDKSIPKEFHLDLEDIQETQPCGTYEFQLPNYYSDGLASDWEHVE
ncbi:uncharacterized protein LOC133307548 [Gastrolobium bilobum]|uniref:uncharacterized protein LOC133307548 n=1 Tax=Gastrolobium bilobum TaxID=150636 RepID=UPI002AB30639|nr:uncharacterized protein LOC133307548 [Gastrolobium bilobum]